MKMTFTLILLLTCIFAASAYAELYQVYIKRIDNNLYQDSKSGVIIETQYCYTYTYGEYAVLNYEEFSWDNKLVFNSGTTCMVKAVR